MDKDFISIDEIETKLKELGISSEDFFEAVTNNKIPTFYLHEDGSVQRIHVNAIEDDLVIGELLND